MRESVSVAVIGTLDTKGPEIAYVRDRIRELGCDAVVIDSGILGEANGIVAEVSRRDVAAAAGHTIEEVRSAGSRGAAVEMMSAGVREICLRLWREGRLHAGLALGGAEGALLGAAGLQALPLGVPKMIVSPTFSGRRRFAAFVGESDMIAMHSVVDILGLNAIARSVFDNAAAAVVGMARHAGRVPDWAGAPVGVTMLGNSTPGVMRMRDVLAAAGVETVIFHANGTGGTAMEKLAAAGGLSGIIDYTLAELSNSMMDGLLACGPERLVTGGRCAIPRVVVPGCVDFFNQFAPLPPQWSDRKHYLHNPISTLVRLVPEEMARLGTMVAERLNGATGPLLVVIPTRGFSINAVPGGRLHDAEGDAAFIDALEGGLRDDIRVEHVDTHLNDPAFGEAVAVRYLDLASRWSVQ